MNPFLSFLSGIIAAFTPCVIILIPLVFYRFFNKDKGKKIEFAIFILGFIVSYVFLGILVDNLFNSFIQNGIKLGFGFLFISLGFLSMTNRINPLNFTLFKNPLLFGISFSFIISLNPCTLPYLSLMISLNQKSQVIINMASFGLGLLVPSLSFAVIGKSVLTFANKNAKLFHKISQLMSLILIFSGIYLAMTIQSFEKYDVYISSIFLIVIFMLLLKCFFVINSKKDIFKLKNIFLILSLGLILFAAISHCRTFISSKSNYLVDSGLNFNDDPEELSCSLNDSDCPICTRCITIFALALFFGLLSVLISNKAVRYLN